MNNRDDFNHNISHIVAANYKRIQTRIIELDRYRFLQQKILEFLENPVLTIIDDRWHAVGEKLENAGLISDIELFRNYLEIITKPNITISFLTAPGSRMNDHHSYPGGLVLHTATDIELALQMAEVYEKIYNLSIDKEVLIIALALHDIAKVSVYPWNSRGAYPDEIQIAGTGSHHILSISEAIHRGLPLSIIKAMAFCHNRIIPPESGLKRFLKAAYLLAGAEYPEGLETQIQLEDWLCLLADSDWPLSSWAIQQNIIQSFPGMERTEQLRFLSQETEFNIFR